MSDSYVITQLLHQDVLDSFHENDVARDVSEKVKYWDEAIRLLAEDKGEFLLALQALRIQSERLKQLIRENMEVLTFILRGIDGGSLWEALRGVDAKTLRIFLRDLEDRHLLKHVDDKDLRALIEGLDEVGAEIPEKLEDDRRVLDYLDDGSSVVRRTLDHASLITILNGMDEHRLGSITDVSYRDILENNSAYRALLKQRLEILEQKKSELPADEDGGELTSDDDQGLSSLAGKYDFWIGETRAALHIIRALPEYVETLADTEYAIGAFEHVVFERQLLGREDTFEERQDRISQLGIRESNTVWRVYLEGFRRMYEDCGSSREELKQRYGLDKSKALSNLWRSIARKCPKQGATASAVRKAFDRAEVGGQPINSGTRDVDDVLDRLIALLHLYKLETASNRRSKKDIAPS